MTLRFRLVATTAFLAALTLNGCGGSAPPAPAKAPGTTTATQAPATAPVVVPEGNFALAGDPRALKGGKFVREFNSFPTHINYYGPERDSELANVYAEAMLNTLISVNKNSLEYMPELAESWEVSEDQKTITFHIDPDAKWSDGKPVTAKDVAFTYDLIKHPKVVEVVYKTQLDDQFPNPPEVIDERTVRFVGAKASWRNLLLFDDLYIYPAHAASPDTFLEDWKFKAPVVSGQYQLGNFEKDKFITLERRKDFWGEGKRQFIGTGNFDTIYTKTILTDDLMFEAMKKGDIDFYLVIQAKRWHKECDIEKTRKGYIQKARVYYRYPESVAEWAFNLNDPLFSDVRVRKGLFWLLDREQLHDQLFFHEYTNKNSYWPNSIYENPANEKITFNPEKGLALLKEAGFKERDTDGTLMRGGKRLQFEFIYIHKDAERVYTPLQESYRKYGVQMDLKLIAPSSWVKLSSKKEFRLMYAAWSPELFPNPRDAWHSSTADKDDTSNICRFKNAEVDKLIEAYELEPDLKKRAGILQKVDGLIYDQCPYMLNWYSDNFRLMWWDKLGMPEWMGYATQDPRDTNWKIWWCDPAKASRLEEAMRSGTSVPLAAAENRYWKEHGS